MKPYLIYFLAITCLAFKADNLTQEITEAKFKFDLPNDKWSLWVNESYKKVVLYSYKREAIFDSANNLDIIPNISIVIEDLDRDLDLGTYTVTKRAEVNFEVIDIYTYSKGNIGIENAIGYKCKYIGSNKMEHTIYVVHGVNKRKGFQIICDGTSSVHDIVESEFLATLKSVRK